MLSSLVVHGDGDTLDLLWLFLLRGDFSDELRKAALARPCIPLFFQGSPGFGIPGQPGLKGDIGDRVSGTMGWVWNGKGSGDKPGGLGTKSLRHLHGFVGLHLGGDERWGGDKERRW